ncbi:unnamed protein product [Discosporangium mesarthrocarpum]
MNGSCRWGGRCTFIHDQAARDEHQRVTGGEGPPGGAPPGHLRNRKTHPQHQANAPPTLLRKLLAPQLRRESSIILQAIRYVVSSGFFLETSCAEEGSESLGAAAVPGEDARKEGEVGGAEWESSIADNLKHGSSADNADGGNGSPADGGVGLGLASLVAKESTESSESGAAPIGLIAAQDPA